MAEFTPIHFYDEPVEVHFISPPAREKTPDCPESFTWNGRVYHILETLSEWSDFTRRGRFARNMRPAHAAVASTRGSLNVGRFYFRVKVCFSSSSISSPLGAAGETEGSPATGESGNQIFDIYYDRAMKSVDERKGQWFVYRELIEKGAADV